MSIFYIKISRALPCIFWKKPYTCQDKPYIYYTLGGGTLSALGAMRTVRICCGSRSEGESERA